MNRRDFLKRTGMMLGALALPGLPRIPAPPEAQAATLANGSTRMLDNFGTKITFYHATPIYAPDPDNYGKYIKVGEVRS